MILTADNLAAPAASDGDLLARYARQGDQQAFRDLVRRHIDWLYAAALRLTGNSALAEDVTQGVLLALSRKAPALARRTCLAGWLFQATRYGAGTLLRAESRRKERERMHARTLSASDAPPAWDDLKDRLDRAVARLSGSDRQALLLRYYQRLPHDAMAAALGISEEAARKRVTRALERLRHALGVTASTSALGTALVNIPTVTAPAHLLHGVLAGAVSAKAALIAKGVSLMAIASKIKIALAVSAITLLSGYLVGAYALGQAGGAGQPAAAATSVTVGGGTVRGGGGGGGGSSGGSGFGWGAGGSGGGGGVSVSGSGATAVSSWSDGRTTVRRFSDGTHDITLTTTDGATTALVKDAAGKVLFDGPYTSEADKAKVPADLADKLARAAAPAGAMMGMGMMGAGAGRAGIGAAPAARGTGSTRGAAANGPARPTLASVKAALNPTDAEWAALQDKVQLVLKLQGYLNAGAALAQPAAPDPANPLTAPTNELNQALKDPNVTGDALAEKTAAVRAARKEVQDRLTAAQKDLDAAATLRQRAVLLELGLLP